MAAMHGRPLAVDGNGYARAGCNRTGRAGAPRPAVLILALLFGCVMGTGMAPAEDQPPADFQPGAISIGEPISLPFGTSQTQAATGPAGDPAATAPIPTARAIPGSGWLGLAVAESNVPGRWRIDDVSPNGPAARAGIRSGDELRAVNGIPLRNAEEASQALTAIAAGQEVRVAIARADQVSDITLQAEPRPTAAPSRTWQSADNAPPVEATPAPGIASAPQTAAPLAAPPQTAATVPATAPPDFRSPPAMLPPAGAADPSARSVVVPESAPAALLPPPAAPSLPTAPSLTTAAPRGIEPSRPSADRKGRTALGVRTLPIDPGMQSRFNLREPAGAYVIGVVQDLPASKAGVPPGSVIVSLDNRPVRSPLDLSNLVTSGPVDRPVMLQFVLPGGEAKRAEVVLQSLETPLEQALVGTPQPAAAIPALEPGPIPGRAERPVSAPSGAASAAPLREEIRWLRGRLERLEQRLEALAVPRR